MSSIQVTQESEAEQTAVIRWEVLNPLMELSRRKPISFEIFGDHQIRLTSDFNTVTCEGLKTFRLTFGLHWPNEDLADPSIRFHGWTMVKQNDLRAEFLRLENRKIGANDGLSVLLRVTNPRSPLAVTYCFDFKRDIPAFKPCPIAMPAPSAFYKPAFNDETFSDVAVVCGDTVVACHKVVLAGSSDFFKTMFTSNFKEAKQNRIELTGLKPEVALHLLKFIYEDTVASEAISWDLFDAAKMYGLERLQKLCLRGLYRSLNVDNCCQMLKAADLHDLTDFYDLAAKFAGKNRDAVIQTEDWKSLEADNGQMVKRLELEWELHDFKH